MKLFHISDIHLTKSFLSDWHDYMCKAFIDYVNQTKDPNSIIVCTGDLIDKGGKEWGSARDAFIVFKNDVITPILKETGMSIDRFVLCPGNHDIERSCDASFVQAGVRTEIKEGGANKINLITSQIMNGDYQASSRIKTYNEFVMELYSNCDNVNISPLAVTFQYDIEGCKVGIASFNTVWNSVDDYDKDYGLGIGEPQYKKTRDLLSSSDIKIAALHHPLDWFLYEKESVITWMTQDFDLILMGHVHEKDTGMTLKPNSSYAYNISPSFSSNFRGKTAIYVNGFTDIEISDDYQDVFCKYLVYDHSNRAYRLNIEYTDNGIFEFSYKKDGSNLSALVRRCLKHIEEELFPKIDASLIPQKASVVSTLDDAFVMPPIHKNGGEDSRKEYPLSAIINSSSNIVLFGQGESGKTILLYKCLKDFVRDYAIHQLIPVFFDFSSNSNQDYETIIKEFLSCSTKEVNKLIAEQKIILLVDNYSVDIEYKEKKTALYRFIADNSIRVIASSEYQLSDTIPIQFVNNNEIAFEAFFIHQFSAEKVKELMQKWSPQDSHTIRLDKIEKMVDKFCSYSLPCSAMSVSLYLWCTENESRSPVNSAYLLDIYLEIILEKMSMENIYRDSFNYNNKCNLLSYIAYKCNEIIKKNNGTYDYELTKGELILITEEYLKSVGHTQFKADRIIDYFIKQRVFIQEGNYVHYAHACFFYFFLAKRMISNKEFREEVMSEDNYFKYERVLDYYEGLVMSDKDWLEELFARFERFFAGGYEIIERINIDDFFTRIVAGDNNKRFIPIAEKIQPNDVVKSKPSISEVEKKTLAVADKRLDKISDRLSSDEVLSSGNMLVMMAKALRNLESVEDLTLKQRIYKSLIRNSLVYTVMSKDYFAQYANTHKGNLPPALSDIRDVYTFLRFMPYLFQFNMYDLIGTTKLQSIFETKYQEDIATKRSDVEKYLTLAMMWDNANVKYEKEYRKMIRSVGNNSVQDYLLMKLLYYFRNKVVLGSDSEDVYIDLIAESKIKVQRLGKFKKGEIIKQMKEEQKKLLQGRNKKD